MKESFTKIKNKIKEWIPFRKMNSHTYWNYLLSIFFILVSVLILFSFYLLYKIKNEQIFQVTTKTTETINLMNDKLFEKVIKSFKDKSINKERIESGSILYEDPSLN